MALNNRKKISINYIIKQLGWLPQIFILLSLWELRIEIRLLFDNFTFMALFYCIYNHPLAICVLLLTPKILETNLTK